MILWRHSGGLLAIPQQEHARASGAIAERLARRWFEPGLRAETISATGAHDIGWAEWDASPRLDADGLPVDFMAMEQDEHEAIWRRGVAIAEQAWGPFAALLLNAHGQSFVPEDAAERFAWHAQQGARLARACWPDEDPARRDWKLERSLRILRLCDTAALSPFAGWVGPLDSELADDAGRWSGSAVRWDGGAVSRVSGWPFDGGAFEVPVNALDLASGWDSRRPVERVLRIEPS